jgi:hypothetical protein
METILLKREKILLMLMSSSHKHVFHGEGILQSFKSTIISTGASNVSQETCSLV